MLGVRRTIYSRIIWDWGGFDGPVDKLLIRTKPQTNLAGNEGSYLYRSCSPSHCIGPAEGTRPEPMRIEIKTILRRLTMITSAAGALK